MILALYEFTIQMCSSRNLKTNSEFSISQIGILYGQVL